MLKIGFTSTMAAYSWGGSEELWSQVAVLAHKREYQIALSIPPWNSLHPRLQTLQEEGVRLTRRRASGLQLPKAWRAISRGLRRIGLEIKPYHDFLDTTDWQASFPEPLDLMVISQGGVFCGLREPGLIPWLNQTQVPYIVICQCNYAQAQLNDDLREQALAYLCSAQQVAFVSHENLETAQVQLAATLSNAIVVQNPLNLVDTSPVAWPKEVDTLQLACVARLQVHAKGQDILLQALAQPQWQQREFKLNLYGRGPDAAYLKRLALY
jgi:hypothetical protein